MLLTNFLRIKAVFLAVFLPLSSTFINIFPSMSVNTSSRVGILYFPSTKTLLSASIVISSIKPALLVRRSNFLSWKTTISPDAQRKTSISTPSTPRLIAFCIDSKVFSAICPLAPLWPILSISLF